jgi:hypothetical protein
MFIGMVSHPVGRVIRGQKVAFIANANAKRHRDRRFQRRMREVGQGFGAALAAAILFCRSAKSQGSM